MEKIAFLEILWLSVEEKEQMQRSPDRAVVPVAAVVREEMGPR
jgi:hypothetical protein